jgi:hypothetical protein
MDDTLFADVCARQLAAAEAMLRKAIDACPDDEWAARHGDEAPFWQQVLHTVLVTHFYHLRERGSPEDHAIDERIMRDLGQPMKDWSEAEQKRMRDVLFKLTDRDYLPPGVITKELMMRYVEDMSRAGEEMIARLRAGGGSDANGTMEWTGPTVADRIVYNIRHAQHHVGRLHSTLGRRRGIKLKWNRVGERQ